MKRNKGKDIIKCMRLIKYGMSVKQSIGTMILFILIGIAMEMVTVLGAGGLFLNGGLDFGAVFLYSATLVPAQILMTLDISGMVQASPYKRKIQTGAMSFASLCGNLAAMLILLLIRGLGACIMPENASLIWSTLPVIGVMGFGLSIMGALMYKFYILSIIVLAGVFGTLGGMIRYQGRMEMDVPGILTGMTLPAAIVFCFAMIFLGNGIQYLVVRAIYKRPFSRGAFGSAIGKKFI